jgi:hypothetical protein
MAAITSTASGDWNVGGTWVGGVAPGNGDTATIAAGHTVTVTADQIVGTSGVAGTMAIAIASTSQVTVAAGIRLTVRGDTRADGVLRMEAGSTYEFGAGGSAQIYKITTSTTGFTAARVVAAGTSGSRCTFTKEAGAGNGIICRFSTAAAARLGLTADYTDFVNIGSSSVSFGNHAINVSCSGATQEIHLHDCTMTSCGAVEATISAACHMSVQRVRFITPLFSPSASPPGLYFIANAPSGGATRIVRNVDGRRANLGFATSVHDADCQYNTWYQMDDANSGLSVTTIGAINRRYNLIVPRADVQSRIGVPGETFQDYILWVSSSATCQQGINGGWPGNWPAGTITFKRGLYGQDLASEEIDFMQPVAITSAHGPFTYRQEQCLVQLNARGRPAGNIVSCHGSTRNAIEVVHCTGGTHDSNSGGNAYFFANHGTTFAGYAGFVKEIRSNLVYAMSTLANRGWMLFYYGLYPSALAISAFFGTATAGTTTTLTETGKGFPTGTLQKFSDSGALLYMTSGLNAGLSRAITNNTATVITTAAFPSANAAGDTYKVVVADTRVSGMVDYNAGFNVRDGTVWDATGQVGTAKYGYEALACTDSSDLGVNDINLGTGADLVTAGPEFVDPTRGFEKWAAENATMLGLSTPSDWLTATTYTIGDRVKAQTSTFFNNAVIWFRCWANKGSASAAGDKPGSGASWRTYWELESVAVVADCCYANTLVSDAALGLSNTNVIDHAIAWVREGFRPRNETLRGAGHDGEDVGAVEMAAAAPGAPTTTAGGGGGVMQLAIQMHRLGRVA